MLTELIGVLVQSGVLGISDDIEVIETHISVVLLTGTFAYKFKKPVNLGFVDFSSLEKRKYYCSEELRLNRRLAPDLYMGVVRITGSIQQPELDGAGECLEYAVKMKQFPRHSELSTCIHEGSVYPSHFIQLAKDLARFHDGASVADSGDQFAGIEGLTHRVMDNFLNINPCIHSSELLYRIAALQQWTEKALSTCGKKFIERKQQRRVRECHGDLHLANLVLLDDVIVPFDCLEFNRDFRWIDIASEIAFLLMDLVANGYQKHARVFMDTYLECSGDYDMITLIRYYMVYRAMVRAKVACLGCFQKHRDCATDPAFLKYLAVAEEFVEKPENVQLIITHGLSGCGKTWVSKLLLQRLDLIHIRSDVVRKHLYKVEVDQSSRSMLDGGIYTEGATLLVYDTLLSYARNVVQAGYPVIIDATFLKKEQREKFRKLAQERNIPFKILHLDAAKSLLESRITNRKSAGTDASEADLAVLERQIKSVQPLDSNEQRFEINVNSDIQWTDSSLQSLVKRLKLV